MPQVTQNHEVRTATSRDATLDLVRGLAIIAMVVGHLVVALRDIPYSRPLFVAGGMAPVLFVFLSGYLVEFLHHRKNYGFGYFFIRGIFLLLVGAAVDVFIWRIIPFYTMDILYFIGISLPILYLLNRQNTYRLVLLAGAIVVATPFMQYIMGYAPYPTELYLDGSPTIEAPYHYAIWKHYLVDGWFPLFPWLGVSLAGMLFYRWRTQGDSHGIFRWGIVLTGVGLFLWWPVWPGLDIRLQYGGIFMPPEPGYLIASLGLTLLLFWVLDAWSRKDTLRVVSAIGRSSLFFYVMHLVLIKYFIPALGVVQSPLFLLKSFVLIGGILGISGWLIHYLKTRTSRLPLLVRFFLGG